MADEVELIITGAPVYTVDAVRGWASAVAVGGGRIAAVGAERDVLALRGPRTRGLELLRCSLTDTDPDDYAAATTRWAADHPDAPWLLGGGWRMDAFPGGVPPAGLLDRLVPGRPVWLESRDGHSGWATAQAYLHRLGISAWQDAWVLPAQLDAYRAAAAAAKLTARVVAALKWQPEAGEEQLDGLVEQRRTASVGRLRAGAVKIVQDGVFENFTAAMLDPYLGRDGGRGISMLPADELARVVTLLDAEGFDVHVHAIGDRAVREALDAFEAAARANGHRDARHQIAHLQFVHPDDRPRFRRLGVVANAQPFWAVLDGYMRDLTLPFVSAERADWQYPWASLRRAGAPFLPVERLDLPAALDAATIGAAYANRLDATTGSIEPGKLADLAVLDRDLFDPGPGPVGDARVLATFVEGEVVHAEEALGW